MVGLLGCGLAVGQSAARPAAAKSPVLAKSSVVAGPTKPMAFDVVSIRSSAPGSPWGGVQVLPDGYRAWGIGLWATVADAYFPSELYTPDRLLGQQPWMSSEKYDIEAKGAPVDVAEWQRQSNFKQQKVMLQAMLQTMLAERCKLVVHRIPAEISGYALVVGKDGPKFKETKPGKTIPSGIPLPDGGVMVGAARDGKLENSYLFSVLMPAQEGYLLRLCVWVV